MAQQQANDRPAPEASDFRSSRQTDGGTYFASNGETIAVGDMNMTAHAASHRDKNTQHLRLVHSRPAPGITPRIASATLADTRAYLEDMIEAWQALAALSVPQHIPAPVAGPPFRQISIASQAFPGAAHHRLSVGGAGLEIA
jgi:acetoacetate decarboxylase